MDAFSITGALLLSAYKMCFCNCVVVRTFGLGERLDNLVHAHNFRKAFEVYCAPRSLWKVSCRGLPLSLNARLKVDAIRYVLFFVDIPCATLHMVLLLLNLRCFLYPFLELMTMLSIPTSRISSATYLGEVLTPRADKTAAILLAPYLCLLSLNTD